MRALFFPIALLFSTIGLAGCATVQPVDIAQVQSGALGRTQATAIKVRSVRQEYEIVNALGLEVKSQALTFPDGKPHDVLTVKDPTTGEVSKLWFDISSFFGKAF